MLLSYSHIAPLMAYGLQAMGGLKYMQISMDMCLCYMIGNVDIENLAIHNYTVFWEYIPCFSTYHYLLFCFVCVLLCMYFI